ncbi:MAG: hypothetical protein ABII18_09060 [bacterium]|nr:hypothetical protein [bacterium]MBU1918225.1 hypothetical protein [bacterium]
MNKELIRKISKILSYAFIICLLLYGYSYFKTEQLPSPKEIDAQLLEQPTQTQTDRQPFTMLFGDKEYVITPLYDYELTGLVVSYSDLDKMWFNIYYDRDPYNRKDVCVIFGSNLARNYYQKVDYHSGSWTCYYSYEFKDVPYFNHEELSNNHLITANEEISHQLNEVRSGDQIKVKGYLVNYSINGEQGARTTSTTRTDKGQGACEVIYVEELEIIKSANFMWRALNDFTFGLMILIIIIKLYMFFAL